MLVARMLTGGPRSRVLLHSGHGTGARARGPQFFGNGDYFKRVLPLSCSSLRGARGAAGTEVTWSAFSPRGTAEELQHVTSVALHRASVMTSRKRRKSGPRAASYCRFEEDDMLPVPRSLPPEDAASHTIGSTRQSGAQSSRTSPATGNQSPEAVQSGRRESVGCPADNPAASSLSKSYEGDAVNMEIVSFSCSDIGWCGLTDDEDVDGIFKSSRELHCYGYHFGKGRLTVRHHDRMREVGNDLCAVEQTPSRWRLGKIRAALLKRVALVRWQRKSTTLPVGKGNTVRQLPDVRLGYIPFSAHVVRDFADPVTAALFRDAGDSALGSAERPAESFRPWRLGIRRTATFVVDSASTATCTKSGAP